MFLITGKRHANINIPRMFQEFLMIVLFTISRLKIVSKQFLIYDLYQVDLFRSEHFARQGMQNI